TGPAGWTMVLRLLSVMLYPANPGQVGPDGTTARPRAMLAPSAPDGARPESASAAAVEPIANPSARPSRACVRIVIMISSQSKCHTRLSAPGTQMLTSGPGARSRAG